MALESAGMDGAVREEGIMGGVWVSGYVCFRGFQCGSVQKRENNRIL